PESSRQRRSTRKSTMADLYFLRAPSCSLWLLLLFCLQRACVYEKSLAWHNANIGQVPVSLRVIQPVAHNELVRNAEPYVISLNRLFAPRRFIEQSGNAKSFRLTRQNQLLQIRERKPGVENIFDEDYVFSLDRLIGIFGEANLAGRIPAAFQFLSRTGPVAIARDSNEVERSIELDLS